MGEPKMRQLPCHGVCAGAAPKDPGWIVHGIAGPGYLQIRAGALKSLPACDAQALQIGRAGGRQ